jgi:hypothetical protein
MIALPVSGAVVALRGPNGSDDMALAEASGGATAIGIALLSRLCGAALDAAALPITDFEHLLLAVRAAQLGRTMALGFVCPHCRVVAELSFRLDQFIASVEPRAAPDVVPDRDRPNWFVVEGAGFRLPTAGDQVLVAGAARPDRRLAELCLDEVARTPPHKRRVERAMQTMAPIYSQAIGGVCPSCDTPVETRFIVADVVVGELKRAAGAVHDEVAAIAAAYHWSEAAILSLPAPRRRAYAECIRRVLPRAA